MCSKSALSEKVDRVKENGGYRCKVCRQIFPDDGWDDSLEVAYNHVRKIMRPCVNISNGWRAMTETEDIIEVLENMDGVQDVDVANRAQYGNQQKAHFLVE